MHLKSFPSEDQSHMTEAFVGEQPLDSHSSHPKLTTGKLQPRNSHFSLPSSFNAYGTGSPDKLSPGEIKL